MITRTSPDVGYLKPDVFDTYAFRQNVRAGNTVYFAGIAPLKGGLDDLELVGEGDIVAQTNFILGVLDRSLAAEGLDRSNLVTWTFYTTDFAALAAVLPSILVPWVGEHRPSSTTVEVRALLHPAQLIEITAIAVAV